MNPEQAQVAAASAPASEPKKSGFLANFFGGFFGGHKAEETPPIPTQQNAMQEGSKAFMATGDPNLAMNTAALAAQPPAEAAAVPTPAPVQTNP